MKHEGRLRFGNKNKRVHFVILSTCTTFALQLAVFNMTKIVQVERNRAKII